MHRFSRAASPAASRARARAKVLLATTCVAIAALTLAACFDRTTAPQPSLAPVPRHDFLGDANWGANNSLASGSYDGTIDLVYGGAPHAAQALGPFVYPTFITANVSGQVRQVPGAVQGQNIVREAWSTNDPYFWGSMGFHSNGSVWWPVGPSAILRVVAPIAPFRNDAGGQPTGDWSHCGWAGYALCWSWAGAAHFDFQRIHVDLTLARSPDTTVWQGTAATFTAGMSQTSFPGNPYPVDMSALQWRWISDSTASDSAACQSTSGRSCTRVFMTPGTMYTAAYVNGEAQQKSMHVDVRIPKLELSASKTTLLAPGDSDTFVATGDLPMVIEGWNFAPDTVGGSSPDAAVGSTWGACVANASTCTNYVSRPGTVSVIGTVHGVRRTARLHVNFVPPHMTVIATKPTLVVGDSSTFVAMANASPLVVQGWAFRADGSNDPGATVGSSWGTCVPNTPVCTMVLPTSGTVVAIGTVAGFSLLDSTHVTVTLPDTSGGCPTMIRSPANGDRLAPTRSSDCVPVDPGLPPEIDSTAVEPMNVEYQCPPRYYQDKPWNTRSTTNDPVTIFSPIQLVASFPDAGQLDPFYTGIPYGVYSPALITSPPNFVGKGAMRMICKTWLLNNLSPQGQPLFGGRLLFHDAVVVVEIQH